MAGSTSSENRVDWVAPDSGQQTDRALEQTLAVQASSSSIAHQRAALNRAEALLSQGSVPLRRADLVEILELIALEPLRVRSSNGARSTTPILRMRAAELLVRTGGPEAADALVAAVELEQDATVLANIYALLPDLIDLPGPRLRALMIGHLRSSLAYGRDEALLSSVLSAAERFDQNGPGLRDPELFRAILDVLGAPYSSETLDRARRILRSMRENEREG